MGNATTGVSSKGPTIEPWMNNVAATQAAGATGTLPSHITGDLLIAVVFRSGSTTQATKATATNPWLDPAGSATVAGTTCCARMHYKIAASSSETTGTWTNATSVAYYRIRNASGVGSVVWGQGSGTTLTYPTGAARTGAPSSWYMRAGMHRTATDMSTNAVSGFTQRVGSGTATLIRLLDTNYPATAPSSATQTVNASSGWICATIELLAASQPTTELIGYNDAPTGSMRGSGTLTQSSVYSGTTAASYANMTNGNAAGNSSNAAGTNVGSGSGNPAFIKYDCGSSVAITDVVIGYDYNSSMPGGWGPPYTANAVLERSTDNTNWTYITTMPEYTTAQAEGVINGKVKIEVNATARYIRLRKDTTYVQATEFQVWS